MASESELLQRSGSQCELCKGKQALDIYVLPDSEGQSDPEVLLCDTCRQHMADLSVANMDHWRCLADSMWSPEPAVQVLSWRLLKGLESDAWARDQLEMLYLDESLQSWAEAGIEDQEESDQEPTLDANGARLSAGDSVTIIKDLDVKGTSFVAKRGTAVRNISLTSNPEHIEGRVNGTRIVIIAAYVKKN